MCSLEDDLKAVNSKKQRSARNLLEWMIDGVMKKEKMKQLGDGDV